jgi:peroxiredoxin
LLYVFASTDRDADLVAQIVKRLEPEARTSNVAILGVARDVVLEDAERFVQRQEFEFPIVLDGDRRISQQIGVTPGKPSLLAVDSEGYLLGGFVGLEGEVPNPDVVYEREVRHLLRLEVADGLEESFGVLPEAPDFRLVSLDGKRATRSTLMGKVAVLVFFSPVCPHCKEALRFLQRLVDELAHPDLEVVAVSILNRRYLVEDMLEDLDLGFPGYLDPDYAVQKAYAHRYTVPEVIVITREGRVFGRHQGFSTRIEALLTMEVKQALSVENVVLLEENGYSGGENCQICHRPQHETWVLTKHADAFESLVTHGAERDPECLPCHTVGWNTPGGYSLENRIDYLEGVQCESCHFRGGPHQSPKIPPDGYEPVCLPCHTPLHSLNFVFSEKLPFVSHAANLQVTTLSIEERHTRRAKYERRERTLFHSDRYVGSEACRDCHVKQYEDGLALVGCESCHGPGETHARESSPEPGSPSMGTILRLTDKCQTCVILQICGSCHDPENDPGFEFELLEKVEQLRHGDAKMPSGTP